MKGDKIGMGHEALHIWTCSLMLHTMIKVDAVIPVL